MAIQLVNNGSACINDFFSVECVRIKSAVWLWNSRNSCSRIQHDVFLFLIAYKYV